MWGYQNKKIQKQDCDGAFKIKHNFNMQLYIREYDSTL